MHPITYLKSLPLCELRRRQRLLQHAINQAVDTGNDFALCNLRAKMDTLETAINIKCCRLKLGLEA